MFGASIGALPSFSLCGLMVVAGEILRIADLSLASVPLTSGGDVTVSIAFGAFLGPHVAFGGGAAALAYFARGNDVFPEFPYHPAKNVTVALGNRYDVLLVGGCFGVAGLLLAETGRYIALPWDPVAFGVVASALLHRWAFGYHLLGDFSGSVFSMRSHSASNPTTSSPEPWLPYQMKWKDVSLLSASMGALGGYTAYVTGSAFLAFGISVVALVLMNAGRERIPVTHHMTLPASAAPLAYYGANQSLVTHDWTASLPLAGFVILGILFGWIGGVSGEGLQRLVYAHAETHLDPPATSIVFTTLLIAVLSLIGVFDGSVWIPLPMDG